MILDIIPSGLALDGIVSARVDGDIGDLALDLGDLDYDADIDDPRPRLCQQFRRVDSPSQLPMA